MRASVSPVAEAGAEPEEVDGLVVLEELDEPRAVPVSVSFAESVNAVEIKVGSLDELTDMMVECENACCV